MRRPIPRAAGRGGMSKLIRKAIGKPGPKAVLREARRLRTAAERLEATDDYARLEVRGRIEALRAIERFAKTGRPRDLRPVAGAESS